MEKKFFGSVAIAKGYITPGQLLECLNIQRVEDAEDKKHRLVGEILFEKGYLTKEQFEDVLKSIGKTVSASEIDTKQPMFGDVARAKGYADSELILTALNIQQKEKSEGRPHRLIGKIMLDEGYINEDQLNEILDICSGEDK